MGRPPSDRGSTPRLTLPWHASFPRVGAVPVDHDVPVSGFLEPLSDGETEESLESHL